LLACSVAAARAEEPTKSFTFNVSGRANVRVETNDGSVRVTSGDSKQVEFRVEYQGYELGRDLRATLIKTATSTVDGPHHRPLGILLGPQFAALAH